MVLNIPREAALAMRVDRDSCANEQGREGFDVRFQALTIHFEDEADAEHLARLIMNRLGTRGFVNW